MLYIKITIFMKKIFEALINTTKVKKISIKL